MQDRMTKWPVLLVHGLFYREDYWGRVPGVLRREGAVVLCPRHQSTARVAQSGGQLARLIREAAREGGKVNLIAHSKGGLDSRWAISREGAAPYVASLTTVNTPHRGCLFVDKLLDKLPRPLQRSIAAGYDAALEPEITDYYYYALGDWSAVGRMQSLRELSIAEICVEDFGFLATCKSLRTLDLHNTNFTDCRLLASLPKLQYANLRDCPLTHTEALEAREKSLFCQR